MKRAIACLLVISLALLLKSCNTTEPPPPPPDGEKPTLALKLEDVSCTEAWIELTTTNLSLPATITLKKDNVGQTISLSTADTILYVDSLLPNQSYKYQASSIPQSGGQQQVSSNELNVTTMDTTSHDFTFQSWTFGTIGSSTLYDVVIINENNIWAVGEIKIADTSQNGYTMYNAVHWDGIEWALKRIPYLFQGDSFYSPIYAIFAFNADDIWFGIGNLIHWDGIKYWSIGISSVFPSLVKKIWGSSSNNLYVVGNNGTIAWYNGVQWRRIESGTELDFHDIYGATDPKTGEQQILAVCSRNLPLGKGIYRIQENTVVEISSAPIQWELYAVWFIPNRHYFVIGNGIYEKKFLTDFLWKDNGFDITHYATTGIRGNGLNDVFIAGAFGEFLHFNGITWKSYINELGWFSGSYGGVAVKDNMVITVGYESAKAKILIGKK
ncbi:MAG: glucosyl transferase [Ignavibacteriaceae bacterium]|nr:glucosyl transferase [Ignavibacteriaceae bacterium]